MPIFCVKSVKIYTGQKNLHEYTRGSRDKYEVCEQDDGDDGQDEEDVDVSHPLTSSTTLTTRLTWVLVP